MDIRLSKADDLQYLADVERSAAKKFTLFFQDNPSHPSMCQGDWDDAILEHEILVDAYGNKTLWVVEDKGKVVGFLAATVVDEMLHIEELSVSFDCQGQGMGKKLVVHVIEEANDKKYVGLSLTTDKTIPWNKPFYQKMNFEEVDLENCPDGLYQTLLKEKKYHDKPENRIAMVLKFDT